MFLASSCCFTKSSCISLEEDEQFKIHRAGALLDIITGIFALIIGALAVSKVLHFSAGASYALLGTGILQLGGYIIVGGLYGCFACSYALEMREVEKWEQENYPETPKRILQNPLSR